MQTYKEKVIPRTKVSKIIGKLMPNLVVKDKNIQLNDQIKTNLI